MITYFSFCDEDLSNNSIHDIFHEECILDLINHQNHETVIEYQVLYDEMIIAIREYAFSALFD